MGKDIVAKCKTWESEKTEDGKKSEKFKGVIKEKDWGQRFVLYIYNPEEKQWNELEREDSWHKVLKKIKSLDNPENIKKDRDEMERVLKRWVKKESKFYLL